MKLWLTVFADSCLGSLYGGSKEERGDETVYRRLQIHRDLRLHFGETDSINRLVMAMIIETDDVRRQRRR